MANKKTTNTPDWKKAQQKNTGATTQQSREAVKAAQAPKAVKVRMLTDYRDLVKKGEVWETDSEKAAELVKLHRAEYLKGGEVEMADEVNQTAEDKNEDVKVDEATQTEETPDNGAVANPDGEPKQD